MSTPTPVIIGGLPTLTINSLNPYSGSVDGTNDLLAIYQNSSTSTVNVSRNTYLGISSAPVGLTDIQTLTNKTLTSPTISGPTLSGTVSGTYTLGGTPTFPSSVVTLTGSQTLTNKVLTSPTINSPIITNATLSTDSITGFSSSTSGSIFGISIASAAFTTSNIIPTASLKNASVTADKLATGGASSSITTSQTTTSGSFVDLGTVGPAVTVNIGANGLALVCLYNQGSNSGSNSQWAGYAVSGANTIAASAFIATETQGTGQMGGSFSQLLTGLTPGSTTFTMKYSVSGGTGTFLNRLISVVPL